PYTALFRSRSCVAGPRRSSRRATPGPHSMRPGTPEPPHAPAPLWLRRWSLASERRRHGIPSRPGLTRGSAGSRQPTAPRRRQGPRPRRRSGRRVPGPRARAGRAEGCSQRLLQGLADELLQRGRLGLEQAVDVHGPATAVRAAVHGDATQGAGAAADLGADLVGDLAREALPLVGDRRTDAPEVLRRLDLCGHGLLEVLGALLDRRFDVRDDLAGYATQVHRAPVELARVDLEASHHAPSSTPRR